MTDDNTARELRRALIYATRVRQALPVDDEADRAASAALARRQQREVSRKLFRKLLESTPVDTTPTPPVIEDEE